MDLQLQENIQKQNQLNGVTKRQCQEDVRPEAQLALENRPCLGRPHTGAADVGIQLGCKGSPVRIRYTVPKEVEGTCNAYCSD
jgi:hypothetical protein